MQDHETQPISLAERWGWVGLGGLQGITFSKLERLNWQGAQKTFGFSDATISGICIAGVTGPFLYFSLRTGFPKRAAAIWSISVAAFFALLHVATLAQFDPSGRDSSQLLNYFTALVLASALLAGPLRQTQGFYSRFIAAAVSNTLTLAFALLAGAGVYLIFFLAIEILGAAGPLDPDYESALVYAGRAIYGGATAYFFYLLVERREVIRSLLESLATGCRVIFIPASFVAAALLLTLVLGLTNSIAPLPYEHRPSLAGSSLKLALLLLGIGAIASIASPSKAAALRRLNRFIWIVPASFTFLAGHAIWLRVDQYGLTPERLLAINLCFILAIASIGFTLAGYSAKVILWQDRSMSATVGALTTAFALSVLPLTSWKDLSVRSQVARLTANQDTLDVGAARYLWHSGGDIGRRWLDRFAETLTNEGQAAVLEGIQESDDWMYSPIKVSARKVQDLLSKLHVEPNGAAIPGAFFKQEWPDYHPVNGGLIMQKCFASTKTGPCRLAVYDFMADREGLEILVIPPISQRYSVPLFAQQRDGTAWRDVGYLHPMNDAVIESQEPGIKVVPSNKKDVIIDGVRYGY